jgi:SRSO17 transposase
MQADPHKKNMERMEERVPESDQQQLNHMLTDSDWDHQAVMDQVALESDRWLGGHPNSCLLIDESGFRQSGKHSVGVARQWCGRWGKVDNCQVGVFAALGRDHRVALVDERLYLPQSWVEDPARCRRAGIAESARVFKTKMQLALEMGAHSDFVGSSQHVEGAGREQADIQTDLEEHSLGYQVRSLGDVGTVHHKHSGEVF